MTIESIYRGPELPGQTVVVIGGSAGIGFETARRARAEGAELVITGRDPDRLKAAADELGAQRTSAFDAHDPAAVKEFFDDLRAPLDHVMVTAGRPRYGRMLDMDFDEAREAITEHLLMALEVARNAAGRIRTGGTLLFMAGTGMRQISPGWGAMTAATAAMPKLTATLAVEIAPVRVNLIAAGFVDTPLSAALLGDGLEARRQELRETLPIRRVVEASDVAALAIHIMTNTALTGGTYDVDGGQQFIG